MSTASVPEHVWLIQEPTGHTAHAEHWCVSASVAPLHTDEMNWPG